LLREAQEALSQTQGLTLLKPVIYQRQVIADAPGQSATVFNMSGDAASQAAREYEQLFEEALSYGKA
jgi:chromosome partitioning protein